MTTRERLFGWQHAFDHPVTVVIVAVVAAVLVLSPLVIWIVARGADQNLRKELWQRWRSWLIITPLIVVPMLAGAAWTILAVTVLSLLCYREFARATGLFREKLISALVVMGILAENCAALDQWYFLFMAIFPIVVTALAVGTIFLDRPTGYIQRVALGIFAYALFGMGLAHLSYIATAEDYRPILLSLFLAVELNDVFAFCVGKPIGRHKLAPHTSPGKTIEGALGALVLTTALAATLGHFVFAGTPLDSWPLLLLLGVLVSIMGQFGDLTLSSIKRDLGIKDMAATIPGHGGVLDRFNSMLLVAPTVFHFVVAVLRVDLDQPRRIITGG